MENFIVRIYRRSSDDPYSVNGVVEVPDLGVSKEFKSGEELFSILIPSGKDLENNRRKQVIENRKYRRFSIKDCTLTFDSSTDVGELVDISMGGLSFSCAEKPDETDSSFEVGIICGEDKFSIDKIQCRKLLYQDSESSSLFRVKEKGNRYGIEFGDLTSKQRLSLEHIIQNYTLNEI